MIPAKPQDLPFVDTLIKPEWNQDCFAWMYEIPLYLNGKDVRDEEDSYFVGLFKQVCQCYYDSPIELKFYRETAPDETQSVGYICSSWENERMRSCTK